MTELLPFKCVPRTARFRQHAERTPDCTATKASTHHTSTPVIGEAHSSSPHSRKSRPGYHNLAAGGRQRPARSPTPTTVVAPTRGVADPEQAASCPRSGQRPFPARPWEGDPILWVVAVVGPSVSPLPLRSARPEERYSRCSSCGAWRLVVFASRGPEQLAVGSAHRPVAGWTVIR